MKLSSRIKSISYLKAHASEIVRTLGDQGEPLGNRQIEFGQVEPAADVIARLQERKRDR